ncbi:hypothetical protein ER308_14670 [Egibacter rhizosphaerae]|uniref:5'-nucleotidase n=1 Tax=Egibacter rhizosphaerae TaxID=1670831 RepID=A0A411YHT5_9ACTN|nr:5'/3'-nucleotidase SurE [Egibacter rhizosphaerae]QBI20679.1 hypothetical protein ER308_14670 [Egibacter rhizosphaerae]
MRVLLTNDDGADAPWLSEFSRGLTEAGHRVTVVVPDGNRSGVSGSLAPLPLGRPIDIPLEPLPGIVADEAWAAAECSPSVCAAVALTGLVEERPDIVVSGPNYGWNIGRDIWRSGTAWAAITAWGMGLPAVAVSCAPERHRGDDLARVAQHTAWVIEQLVATPLPELWNLNFPAPPAHAWSGPDWVAMAANERLSASRSEVVDRTPGGGAVVRISQDPGLQVHGDPGTDAHTVQRGRIALSRLRPVDSIAEEA